MTAAREKYETGRLKGAIGLFKRALNGDRGNAAAMAWLSLCYMRQPRFAEGAKLMNRALETAPMSAEVQPVYATLLAGLGRLDGAVNASSRPLAQEPQNGDILRALRVMLMQPPLPPPATHAPVT